MNICIPKERRPFEFRVGMTPVGVQMLVEQGHICFIEHDAGLGAGFSDLEYEKAGASIVYSAHEIFGRADFLLKVSRPLYEEIEWLRPETVIAGLLHLGSARDDKISLMLQKNITALAYESITLPDGTVPVRKPLSKIGGLLVAQIGARLLQNNAGGKGILLGGVAGVPPAEVVIIGAGIAGSCAAEAFIGMGAHLTVIDVNINALEALFEKYSGIATMISIPNNIAKACAYADLVVAAILVPGERPPIVVTREMVQSMKPRSVIMDISIDEGGCVETSRPTTHEKSTYLEEGIIHYCVPNIPSVVARTATYAFLNAAFPFIEEIANNGIDQAVQSSSAISEGALLHRGELKRITRFQPLEDEG